MITIAKVIETNGKTATVEAEKKAACSGCQKNTDGNSCEICGLVGSNKKIQAKAKNDIGAEVGDTVEIESGTGRMLGYSLLVFILPIVIGVVCYFTAGYFSSEESTKLISAVIGFIIMFIIDFIISKIIENKRCDVNIVRIIK